jgi:Family of unknown function (DUF5678)
MKSIADQLPAEIARQIHPDWRKNEVEYWAVRDQLLSQYQGQWIGFADGRVIASGTSPVEVLHAAQQSGRHPFVICVGREEEPCRIRRSRHGGRCQRTAVGGLSIPSTRSDRGCARIYRRSRGRYRGIDRV